jgi:hypothetical protein
MAEYQAGTCNINQVERKKRMVVGIVGFINSAILTIVLAAFPRFYPLYAAIFLLNTVGFMGYIQYRKNFCANLALRKKEKTGEGEKSIEHDQKISDDRKKAVQIVLEAVIASSILTGLTYLIVGSI